MARKTWHFWGMALLLSVMLAVLLFLGVGRSFLNNTNYCKPFKLTVSGISHAEFLLVTVHASSPRGSTIELERSNADLCIAAGSTMHLNDIVLVAPDSIIQKISDLHFLYANENYSIGVSADLRSNKFQSGAIHMNQIFIPQHSAYEKLIGVFMWKGPVKWFFLAFCVMLFVALLLVFRKKLNMLFSNSKPKLHETTTKMRNYFVRYMDVSRSKVRISISVFLFVALSIGFMHKPRYSGMSIEIKEAVHQSIAVNLAKGYGFPKSGFIDSANNYGITEFHPTAELSYTFLSRYNNVYMYHNPPLYQFAAGAFYSVAGVDPILWKKLQFFLLIVFASFLPGLGYKLSGVHGFISALVSAPIVVAAQYHVVDMFEPYVFTLLWLVCIAFVFDKQLLARKLYISLLFGFLLAMLVLTQLDWFLLPPMFIVYFLIVLFRKPTRKKATNFALMLLAFAMPLVLWAFYANSHSNKEQLLALSDTNIADTLLQRQLNQADSLFLTQLSGFRPYRRHTTMNDGGWTVPLEIYEADITQKVIIPAMRQESTIAVASKSSPELLFIAHNEYCERGNPYTQWNTHSNSYYNNDNASLHPMVRVMLFYLKYPSFFFSNSYYKLYNAFSSFVILFVVIWAYFLCILSGYIKQGLPIRRKVSQSLILSCAVIILFYLVVFPENVNHFAFTMGLFLAIAALFLRVYNRTVVVPAIPLAFVFFFITVFLFSIATVGVDKFVQPVFFIIVYQMIYVLMFIFFKNRMFFELPNRSVV